MDRRGEILAIHFPYNSCHLFWCSFASIPDWVPFFSSLSSSLLQIIHSLTALTFCFHLKCCVVVVGFSDLWSCVCACVLLVICIVFFVRYHGCITNTMDLQTLEKMENIVLVSWLVCVRVSLCAQCVHNDNNQRNILYWFRGRNC